jgi:fatty acid desaturase
VPDFRLCRHDYFESLRFLYWHMNYHIEHHMYAAVPCYHLGKLHKAIEKDLPPSPVGLYAAWREIVEILKKQQVDTTYQHIAKIPSPSGNFRDDGK